NLKAVDIERRSNYEISDSYVAKIAKGLVKNPSVTIIKALARGMGVDERDVLQIAGNLSDPDNPWPAQQLVLPMDNLISSPERTRGFKVLKKLKPAQLKQVEKFLESKKWVA